MEIQSTATEIINISELNSLINSTKNAVKQFEEKYSQIKIDCSTKTGYTETKAHWSEIRDIRLAFQRKADATIKDMYSQYKDAKTSVDEIKTSAQEQEDRFKSALDEEDRRKEAEKAAKIQAEKERVAAIRARIENIKQLPVALINKDSEFLRLAIKDLRLSETDASYQEFKQEAELIKDQVLITLCDLLDSKVRSEEIAAQQKAEQERLAEERRKFEQEQKRITDEQEALRIAEYERLQEVKRKADADAAERQAQFKAQQDEIDRQRKELEEKQAEEARKEREKAEAEARKKIEAEEVAKRKADENARLKRLEEEDKAEKFYVEHLDAMSTEEAWQAVYDAVKCNRVDYIADIAARQLSKIK